MTSQTEIQFSKSHSDIFVPDETDLSQAFERTTHLCIAAHQDDIELMAYHGIAECFQQTDKWFGGVTLTNGAGSPRTGVYADYSDEAMQLVRREEQRNAAQVGAYSFQIQLGYPSQQVKEANQTVCQDLRTILEFTEPEVLYLHNPVDKHDTHVASVLRSLEAIRKVPAKHRPKKVYGCEVWCDLDWLPDDKKCRLPVDQRPHLAATLIGLFDSQIAGGKRYDLAIAGRRLANATFSESHATDQVEALTYAMDLTPLVQDDKLSLEAYVLDLLSQFRQDVENRIRAYAVKP